jgi:hypothetical protein
VAPAGAARGEAVRRAPAQARLDVADRVAVLARLAGTASVQLVSLACTASLPAFSPALAAPPQSCPAGGFRGSVEKEGCYG